MMNLGPVVTARASQSRSSHEGADLFPAPSAQGAPLRALPDFYDGSGARGRVLQMTPADRQRAAATIFRAHRDWEIEHILGQCDDDIGEHIRRMVARAALHTKARNQ